MEWIEIKVNIPQDKTDEAAAIANMTVPYGIYIEDYSDLEEKAQEIAHIDLIDEQLIKKDRTKSVIHIYISKEENAIEAVSFLNERLLASGISAEIESIGVDDADWNENWKKYFKAFEIGNRLAVCPSWEEYNNTQNRTVLNLDPGAAFGTGTHATTSLCLEILDSEVKTGQKVLDIGCGSGILAIAASLLGAETAIGVDIDEQSVKTAIENAAQNGVESKTQFLVGDLAQKVSGKFDIVCANIVADVVMRLFENVASYMEDDGILIVSGIIDERAEEVKSSAVEHGFTIRQELTRQNWRAYLLTR